MFYLHFKNNMLEKFKQIEQNLINEKEIHLLFIKELKKRN